MKGLAEAVFRFRSVLIGAAFLLGSVLGRALYDVSPAAWAPLVGVLSLPADHWAVEGGPSGWAPLYLVPAAFVLACFALRAWGTSYISFGVMKDRVVRAERLLVAGPFRFVRNPLYLGNVALGIAIGLLGPPPAVVLTAASMVVVGLVLAAVEEPRLAAAHLEYATYAANVPRLVPRATPWTAPWTSEVRPDLRDGVRGESWALVLAAAFLLLATPLRAWAWPAAALALLAWWALRWRR